MIENMYQCGGLSNGPIPILRPLWPQTKGWKVPRSDFSQPVGDPRKFQQGTFENTLAGCKVMPCTFHHNPKWVNADRAQYVRSSSSPITIVVMTLPKNLLMTISDLDDEKVDGSEVCDGFVPLERLAEFLVTILCWQWYVVVQHWCKRTQMSMLNGWSVMRFRPPMPLRRWPILIALSVCCVVYCGQMVQYRPIEGIEVE